MYQIKTNMSHNRLYMSLNEFIRPEEAKQARDEILAALPHLRPGFTIVNDLREALPAPSKSIEYIKEAQTSAFRSGADKTIRVVKNAIVSMQMRRMQRESGSEYEVLEVDTLEAAEQLLNSYRKQA